MQKKLILPEALKQINSLVLKPLKLVLTNIEAETESKNYAAHRFKIGNKNIIFRVANKTPTKTGQFVTTWKRNQHGITIPFNVTDNIDFFIIALQQHENFGIFILPQLALLQNKILASKIVTGKRGIRLYASWDITTNKQAQKTQLWQAAFFINLYDNMQVNLLKVQHILGV